MTNASCSSRRSVQEIDSAHALASLTNSGSIYPPKRQSTTESSYYPSQYQRPCLPRVVIPCYSAEHELPCGSGSRRRTTSCDLPSFMHRQESLHDHTTTRPPFYPYAQSSSADSSPISPNAPLTPCWEGHDALQVGMNLVHPPNDNQTCTYHYAVPEHWPAGSGALDRLHSPTRNASAKSSFVPPTTDPDWFAYDATYRSDDLERGGLNPFQIADEESYSSPCHFQPESNALSASAPYTSSLSNALMLPPISVASPIVHQPRPIRPIPIISLSDMSSQSTRSPLSINVSTSRHSWPVHDTQNHGTISESWHDLEMQTDKLSPLPLLCQPISQDVLAMFMTREETV